MIEGLMFAQVVQTRGLTATRRARAINPPPTCNPYLLLG